MKQTQCWQGRSLIFRFPIQCTYPPSKRTHHVLITPRACEVTISVAGVVVCLRRKKKKKKRNTLKPFRTPLLSTALFQVARRFLSQPGQEKQALHFRDWIGCGFMCVGRRGGKGGTGENESISKQSKAKRNWIIFTGMKGTAFYLFSRNSNQVRAFFSGIQQIVLGPE